jgi:hydrophobe/amphiphile efflux-1 (HAE1) family protein
MLSKFFIDRPIFATVVAILMVLVGLITIKSLPVAQFPSITPPTVMVSATYPGADAKTIAETVGMPIEEQVNGVEGMMYMSSNSGSDGSYSLTITFDVGTDIDMATVKVQNRIALAEASLPASVKQQGVSVVSQSANNVLFVGLESDNTQMYDALYLTNYARLNLVDELSRLEGVGGVSAFGAGQYAMRIWLDPEKMRIRSLTPSDVIAMIKSQNMAVSAGTAGAPPDAGDEQFQYTLTSQGRLTSADEFANIVLRTEADGSMLRLGDVATVDLGSETYTQVSRISGKQSALIGIQQLPGANALDVAKRAEKKLEELSRYFPKDVRYNIVLNTTEFVDASIAEVLRTLLETTIIVMIVILLFLQNWRAVIIPMITIPVSLIATFAVMKLLGFTINTLTLFGLVLAIAIVVDDAIIVVENCARILDHGKHTPRQAAEKAMYELQGPVIGVALVLMAVFIPTAFISGITGELYKQFALTIAVSTAFSAINALTFTPAMCALFLKPRHEQSKFIIYRWFNSIFGKVTNGYVGIVGRMLRRPALAFVAFIAIIGAAFYGFGKLPTSYVPAEDMGYFMTSVQLPTGASLERTDSLIQHLSTQIKAMPEVKNVISVSGQSFVGGGSASNLGSLFVALKPWSERKGRAHSVDAVIAKVDELTAPIQEAIVFSINPPAIQGLGLTSGAQMQLLDINNYGADEMAKVVSAMQQAAAENNKLAGITSMYEGNVPQYTVKINRDKVKMSGLSINDVYTTLSAFMGGTYVNDYVQFGRVYEVQVSATGKARNTPDDVLKLTVANAAGDMVPFGAFATVEPSMGQANIARYNMYNTAAVTGTPAKGVSSSEAIAEMEDILQDVAGTNFAYAWTGEAYQETQAGTTVSMVLIFAIIMTILVLAAQYESWTDPIAVVVTAPTAILGTVIGCILMSQSVSIYTQIGIILLIGMAAKNAILIVEFATDYRRSGEPIRDAALNAGKVRFRPIMMTSLAFIFGVMPMLFATGAGAASRISLGAAVVFGMAINALLGTLFIPTCWELLQRLSEKVRRKA